MRFVRVYIEGGSEGRTADADFRKGWKKFLTELHEIARAKGFRSLEVIRGKGRGNAFRRFSKCINQHPNDLCVLLADSETAVPPGVGVWDVVKQRAGDRWERPQWATEDHLYLMVHFVETWIITDQDALSLFFKRGFEGKHLPTTNLESRSKSDIEMALKKATQGSSKGPYKHGQAHEIIELVRAERVKTLNHGHRLFKSLGNLINNFPV